MYDSLHISLKFINDYFYVMCVCFRIVVSCTYCVVFLFCLSSYYVPYVASFSGMSIFDCPFCILLRLFTKHWPIKLVNHHHCLFICLYQARKVSGHLCLYKGYQFYFVSMIFDRILELFRLYGIFFILSRHEYIIQFRVYF